MKLAVGHVFRTLLMQLHFLWSDDASHPAARQKRPWGLNRWALLAIYMVYAVLTSSVYFGWRSMSALLLKSGQFEWVCDGQPLSRRDGESGHGDGNEPRYLCELQDAKIQSLFTIAMACHFTCSALAGWLLDTVGPKTVALLGQLFNCISWLLLSFSSREFQAVYPAFVFMGAGADVSVYPTLLIVSLFPKNTAVVMALMGACISTSFFVPYVLKVFWAQVDVSFRMLCIIYVLVGPVFCILLSILFIPHKALKGVDAFKLCVEAEKLKKEDKKNAGGGETAENCLHDAVDFTVSTTEDPAPSTGEGRDVTTREVEMEMTAGLPANGHATEKFNTEWRNNTTAVTASSVGDGCLTTGVTLQDIPCSSVTKTTAAAAASEAGEYSAMQRLETMTGSSVDDRTVDAKHSKKDRQQQYVVMNAREGGEVTRRSVCPSIGDESPSHENSLMLGEGTNNKSGMCAKDLESKNVALSKFQDFGNYVDDPRFKKQQVSFFSQSLTLLYLGICIYFVVCGWAMCYYQEAAGRFLSPAVEHNLELLTPLSTFPCIVFGFLINRMGIMPVIFVLNTCGVVMYICVLCAAGSIVAQQLSVVCFFFYISIFTTQMYVYIESTFDSNHFGKLIGGASMLGGLLSLLSNVFYGGITVHQLSGDTRPVSGALVCLLVLMYPMLGLMTIQRRRKRKNQELEVKKRMQELQTEVLRDGVIV